jgi:hypothetical protein
VRHVKWQGKEYENHFPEINGKAIQFVLVSGKENSFLQESGKVKHY